MNRQELRRASHSHRRLMAWQEAVRLVKMVYGVKRAFPKDEAFCLVTQLRRSAISVPSDIAEGAGRNSTNELIQHLGVASGSLAEVDTQLVIACRLGYLDQASEVFMQASRVGQLVVALRKSLRSRIV